MRSQVSKPGGRHGIPMLAIAVAATFLLGSTAAGETLLTNGELAEWKNGLPAGWTASDGASRGTGKTSRLEPAEGDRGLALAADAGTHVWQALTQTVPVTASACYVLGFEARALDVRKEAGQFNSCYVGLAFFDASGKRLALEISDVRTPTWTAGVIDVIAPPGAVCGEVTIFLSKTGRLEVRSVALAYDALPSRSSFERLVREMDRHYSYFAHRGIDWATLADRHRARAVASRDAREFIDAITPMLAELKDLHVWIDAPDGRRTAPASPTVTSNFDARAVVAKLEGIRQIGRIALVGRTPEGYAYVCVGSLAGDDGPYRQLEAAIEGLLDAPGLILDLRPNGGGDERRAQRIGAIFCDQRRVYARSKVRSGPGHTDFADNSPRTIAPRDGRTFTRPIVCLIGPACVSSGEGFAKIMRALPHVTLVGQPTRGASGNPAPVKLPNGVSVWHSRWVDLLPDGTCVEGKGLAPDVRVEHTGPGDPTLDAGIRVLGEKIRAADRK